MNNIIIVMKKLKILLLIIVTIMALYGIIMIYSVSSIWAQYKFNDAFHNSKFESVGDKIDVWCVQMTAKKLIRR